MLPTKIQFNFLRGFRDDFLEIDLYQKQRLPVAAMFFNGSEQNVQSL
jgi:hypothetical protein